MKNILLSIRPEQVANILNEEKTIEVRKHFPKDYVGWVYIYCTKGKPKLTKIPELELANGKVVARFWCDKVEDIKSQVVNCGNDCLHTTKTMNMTELLKASCLSLKELDSYLGDKNGYAIHISKLEVFEKPRELSEFRVHECRCKHCNHYSADFNCYCCNPYELTKAPQNYCYIEG